MTTVRAHLLILAAALLLGMPAPPVRAQEVGDENAASEDEDSGQEEVVTKKGGGGKMSKHAGDDPEQAKAAEKLRTASSAHVRRFHEVLDELLAEFGYDVKMGQIKGLSNVSIRKVRVSQAIPKTYEDYVELLIAERIRENSQVKLIACVPCKTRTSSLVDGKLMITSPATNMAKLESAATMLGIENFMDVVLVYHTTHMVLAVEVFNAQTKEVVWTRTYNSETLKTRYQKLAIDYSQVEKSRPGEDYVPEYRFMWGLGGAALPNIGGTTADSQMLDLQIRATEKFDNRHSEFGLMLSLLKTTDSIIKSYPSDGTSTSTSTSTNPPDTETKVTQPAPKPFEQAYAFYALYSHLFLGSVESYNEVRSGVHVGIGGLLATGYLAPTARAGWDIYMGRRFSVSFGADYIGPATILVNGESVRAPGGAGGDVVMSLNY
jgi:hypothetical protein